MRERRESPERREESCKKQPPLIRSSAPIIDYPVRIVIKVLGKMKLSRLSERTNSLSEKNLSLLERQVQYQRGFRLVVCLYCEASDLCSDLCSVQATCARLVKLVGWVLQRNVHGLP